ncbi:heavy metal-associated isoprenylated plant protein 12-like [Cynara cardunculus var. scolymus]|uniref:Heavy metal-associated domain, HMA n=1 Tax=Cynara cardunculus var. scolymus TaxID=59895 RepID=A0A103YK82_CYNCS|nr:heavy metal-associated isoprenylated plant protein 12-like [Cynara cardunculus var. scolymus]KVI10583.1 hypothetical protein Ccrd_011012 [Cynara cardunculus var. scolymus]
MAKQKIVVKVMMKNHKSLRKALQISASVCGVESVTLLDKERIAVTGEQIDSVQLTCSLRKRVGHTDLVSVGPVEEKKTVKPISIPEIVRYEYVYPEHHCWHTAPMPLLAVHEFPSNICSIL